MTKVNSEKPVEFFISKEIFLQGSAIDPLPNRYSNDNICLPFFRYYVLAIIILPILFYIPKFFEVRSQSVMWSYQEKIQCRDFVQFYLANQENPARNSTIFAEIRNSSTESIELFDSANDSAENLPQYYAECSKFNFR